MLPGMGHPHTAPSYLERFPHHGPHGHHHYGSEYEALHEVPAEFGPHYDDHEYEAYHHYSPFAQERHDLEHHSLGPHHELHPYGGYHDPYFGGDFAPHHHEFGWDTGYHHEPMHHQHHGDESGEFDYFASMFGRKQGQSSPSATTTKSPAPAKPALTPRTPLKPAVPEKRKNELDGYGRLPPVPPTTPYEHDLPHSYWDVQYAQAQTAIEMLYPHPHPEETHEPVYHHFLNSDEPDQNEYLALFGARELFAQLDDMEPRPKKERRRLGGQRSNENALLRGMMLLEEGNDETLQYG